MILTIDTAKYLTNLNQDLTAVLGGVQYFLPEIVLTASLFIVIVADLLLLKKKGKYISYLSIAGLVVVTVMLILQGLEIFSVGSTSFFSEMLLLDRLSVFLKILFCLGAILSVIFSFSYNRDGLYPHRFGEYHSLIYGLLLGAMLLVMGSNLLLIYLAIEIISICSYVLTNFNFNKKSAEASLKYLLFGAVSSAIMLYGMSLLYGFTGTLNFHSEAFHSGLAQIPVLPYYVAVAMTLAGFIFKLGAVPFHIWAPDIYEGAPTPVVALFSTVPKIAAIIILARFLNGLPESNVVFELDWIRLLAWIAMITMLLGNLSALWQKNAKRMMAYSSIAHAGFMLVGIVAGSTFGLESLLFYASVYLITNFAAFLVISVLSEFSGEENMEDFAGLGRDFPFLGVAAVVIMLSLTGLPPTAGFTAKLLIFSSVYEAYQTNQEPLLLALFIVGLLNTVLALFYYLKIPYYLYFHSRGKENSVLLQHRNNRKIRENILLGFLIFPLLILFFKSNWLTEIISLVTLEFY